MAEISDFPDDIYQSSLALFENFPCKTSDAAQSYAIAHGLSQFYTAPDTRSLPTIEDYARQISFAARDKREAAMTALVKREVNTLAGTNANDGGKNKTTALVPYQWDKDVGSQFHIFGTVVQHAQSVGQDQWQFFGAAIQHAQSVGMDQIQGFGAAIQHANRIKGDQVQYVGLAFRYVGYIKGDQSNIIGPSVNIARKIEGQQVGLVNIVTEECDRRQIGIVNYSNDDWHPQYGLINLRKGKRWKWNIEINFFWSRGKKKK